MAVGEGMGLLDASWWAVWGIWAVGWVLALIGLVVAGLIAWQQRRHDRRLTAGREVMATLRTRRVLFIDAKEMERLYDNLTPERRRKLMDRVDQTVEERESRQRSVGGEVSSEGPRANANAETTAEQATQYTLRDPVPSKILAFAVEELDDADDIVHVDIKEIDSLNALDEDPAQRLQGAAGLVAANDALETRLGVVLSRRSELRLSEIAGTYLLIRATFENRPAGARQNELEIFEAQYCERGGNNRSVLQIECKAEELFDDAPRGAFQGVCLGRFEGWDDECGTGVLRIDAVALFR